MKPTLVSDSRSLPPESRQQPHGSVSNLYEEGLTLRSHRIRAEIHAVREALERTGWNRKQAARLLAISYRGLLYKIQRHHITPAAPDSTGRAKESVEQAQEVAQVRELA